MPHPCETCRNPVADDAAECPACELRRQAREALALQEQRRAARMAPKARVINPDDPRSVPE